MSKEHEWKSSDMRRHITTLKNFEGAGVAAAKAMAEIQEHKLYMEHYGSLKEFSEQELGWTKQRLYQILKFQETRALLPRSSRPRLTSERQSRALANIPEKDRPRVLEEAEKLGKVTSKTITEAAKIIDIQLIEKDQVGHEIPTPAQAAWNRRMEPLEFLQMLSKIRTWAQAKQKSGDKFYSEVSLQELFTDCNNAYSNLKGAVPYSICGQCQGQAPKTCKLCNGRGMISKFSWDHEVPSKQKEMMKKKADDSTPRLSAAGN